MTNTPTTKAKPRKPRSKAAPKDPSAPVKAKAVRKPRKPVVKAGVAFHARGPFKCVCVDGKSRRGLHNSLDRVLGGLDRDEAERTHTLRAREPPAPHIHMREDACISRPRKYPPGSAMKQGSTLDSQVDYTYRQMAPFCISHYVYTDNAASDDSTHATHPHGLLSSYGHLRCMAVIMTSVRSGLFSCRW